MLARLIDLERRAGLVLIATNDEKEETRWSNGSSSGPRSGLSCARMPVREDLTAGGELPVVGASYHPPGAFARHDSVVWAYAVAAQRLGVSRARGDRGHGARYRERRVHASGLGGTGGGGDRGLGGGRVEQHRGRDGWAGLPIRTHPLQAFVTEPYKHRGSTGLCPRWTCTCTSRKRHGRSCSSAPRSWLHNTYSQRSTFDFLAEASKRSIMILPHAAKAPAMRQWAGLCDMTPDSSPISARPRSPASTWRAAWGTWGFKGSPDLRGRRGPGDRDGSRAPARRAALAGTVRGRTDGPRRGLGGDPLELSADRRGGGHRAPLTCGHLDVRCAGSGAVTLGQAPRSTPEER